MNRKVILPVLAVLALGTAAVATHGFGWVKVDAGPLVLHGNVDVREVDLGFRVGGRIAGVAVEEGDKVTQGQMLAKLDTASLNARVQQADAQVAAARAQLARAQDGSRRQDIAAADARVAQARAAADNAARDYRRRGALVGPGAISRDMWDDTVTAYERTQGQLREAQAAASLLRAGSRPEDISAAAANYRAAEAGRNSASIDTGDTRLMAPMAGTIVTRAREPGAIVQPTETVLTLSIDRPMRVRAYISEPDLTRVSPGMRVEVSVDGNPKRYHGSIGYISPKAEFTPKTVETSNLRTDLVYQTRIIVDDPDDALRQGQPVSVGVPAARSAVR